MIEIVKGGCEPGETSLEAAQRELAEELGYEAREWFSLGSAWELPSLMEAPVALFMATGLLAGKISPEETEQLEPVRVSMKEAISLALEGGIDDAVTALVILRAAAFLNQTIAR